MRTIRELAATLFTFDLLVIALLVVGWCDVGCGDNNAPNVRILEAPDAGVDVPADACVATPSTDGCCAFLPDVATAQACANEQPGCGVVACRLADCSFLRLNFCSVDVDAGVDGAAL